MAWHFFKKDFRLLWPLALALAATAALCAVRASMLGHFKEPRGLYQLTLFLPILVCLGIVLVTINAVHQDALPGVRQDWLTRPVRRRDVWLSKLLFVLLMVLLPLFVIDILEQLSLQLPFTMSIEGAAGRGLGLFGVYVLPALVLGAITRSFTDALLLGVVAAVTMSGLFILTLVALPPGAINTVPPGSQWVQFLCAFAVLAIASAATLWFQHTRRRTGLARVMALFGGLMTMATLYALPASASMAIQRWAWGRTEAPLTVSFAPDSLTPANPGYRFSIQNDPAQTDPASAAARLALFQAQEKWFAKIFIPLRAEGIVPGGIMLSDQLGLRILGADGTVYSDSTLVCVRSGGFATSCRENSLEIRATDPGSVGIASLVLPLALYERIKNETVTLQLDLSLTSFEPDPSQLIAVQSDVHQVPRLGSCATRIDADGDEVELRCLTSAPAPSCVMAVIEDPTTQKHNPEMSGCFPNYAPFQMYPSMDVVNPAGMSLPFFDRSGLAHYPLDGSAIGRARIRLTTFTPVAHVHRSLSIPSVRLADWGSPKAQ